MNYKNRIRVILTLLLALAVQACGAVTPPPPDQPTLAPTPVQAEEALRVDTGLCSNPFYPVVTGATWTYNSTGSLSGNFSFTDTITEVREDGFTLESQLDGSPLSQEWACKPEGLASLTFGAGTAGGLSTSGVQMDLNTSNIQGVILPNTINVGNEWAYSLEFDGEMTYIDTTVETLGTASFGFSALGEESVTVPAGTFDAMKIHVDVRLEMDVSYSGFNAPAVFTVPSEIWYAPGVGWVKATSTGAIFGMPFNENIELQSYNIP